MTKFYSECLSSPARAWEGRNGKGESLKGRNRFLKRSETKRTTQFKCNWNRVSCLTCLHPEYCRQRRRYASYRKGNPPLSCSLAKPRGPVPCSPFYTSHQQPLSICSAVRNGLATYTVMLGTYAAPLRMLVRSYACQWMYLVVCADVAAYQDRTLCATGRHSLQCPVPSL